MSISFPSPALNNLLREGELMWSKSERAIREYEYRSSRFRFVLGTLLREGRTAEEQLRSLRRQTGEDSFSSRLLANKGWSPLTHRTFVG